jgi:hypothetical protein
VLLTRGVQQVGLLSSRALVCTQHCGCLQPV